MFEYRYFGTARADVPIDRVAAVGGAANGAIDLHNGFEVHDNAIMLGVRYSFGGSQGAGPLEGWAEPPRNPSMLHHEDTKGTKKNQIFFNAKDAKDYAEYAKAPRAVARSATTPLRELVGFARLCTSAFAPSA